MHTRIRDLVIPVCTALACSASPTPGRVGPAERDVVLETDSAAEGDSSTGESSYDCDCNLDGVIDEHDPDGECDIDGVPDGICTRDPLRDPAAHADEPEDDACPETSTWGEEQSEVYLVERQEFPEGVVCYYEGPAHGEDQEPTVAAGWVRAQATFWTRWRFARANRHRNFLFGQFFVLGSMEYVSNRAHQQMAADLLALYTRVYRASVPHNRQNYRQSYLTDAQARRLTTFNPGTTGWRLLDDWEPLFAGWENSRAGNPNRNGGYRTDAGVWVPEPAGYTFQHWRNRVFGKLEWEHP